VFPLLTPRPPGSTLFPYTTLFRSKALAAAAAEERDVLAGALARWASFLASSADVTDVMDGLARLTDHLDTITELAHDGAGHDARSEEHTSELQSRENLVCRLLLEK